MSKPEHIHMQRERRAAERLGKELHRAGSWNYGGWQIKVDRMGAQAGDPQGANDTLLLGGSVLKMSQCCGCLLLRVCSVFFHSELPLVEWGPLTLMQATCFPEQSADRNHPEISSSKYPEKCFTNPVGTLWPSKVVI
jgi:hypothetical protein